MNKRTFFFLLLLSLHTNAEEKTLTLALPSEKFDSTKTVIWTPVLQATWDGLVKYTGGIPEKIEPPNPLMSQLDKTVWNAKAVLPLENTLIMSGPATAEFIKEIREKTGEPWPRLKPTRSGQGCISIGKLDQTVSFKKQFFPSPTKPLIFHLDQNKSSPVQFFGVRGKRSGRYNFNVSILKHEPKVQHGDLAIEITTRTTGHKLVLYRPKASLHFNKAFKKIITWRKNHEDSQQKQGFYLHSEDDLRIPYISLKTESNLTPRFTGLRYIKGQQLPFFIKDLHLTTDFSLDEKGAKVSIRAQGQGDFFGEPPAPRQWKLHFNRPFFAFLWKDGADRPYYATWIGNTDGLKPFTPPVKKR